MFEFYLVIKQITTKYIIIFNFFNKMNGETITKKVFNDDNKKE
jgi:hypothetical protein